MPAEKTDDIGALIRTELLAQLAESARHREERAKLRAGRLGWLYDPAQSTRATVAFVIYGMLALAGGFALGVWLR